jgi:hypothetical protein
MEILRIEARRWKIDDGLVEQDSAILYLPSSILDSKLAFLPNSKPQATIQRHASRKSTEWSAPR